MASEKIIQQLHEHEKKILKALKGKKLVSPEQLTKTTKLHKDSVEKATLWLKQKDLISVKEDITEYLELTAEGQEYARSGLPEKRLLQAITKGIDDIEKLKSKIAQFSIGLVWIRKNNWAEIKEGKLVITEEGKNALKGKTYEEDIIAKLSKRSIAKRGLRNEVIDNLVKRGLVKVRQYVKKHFGLSLSGKKIVSKIRIGKEIGQLTPQILKIGEWKNKGLRAYDIAIPPAKVYPAKKHFMTQVIEYIRKVWLEMGFKEMTGPIIEVSFWNFDALYQPQDHPARDLADTFYMKIPESGKLPNEEIVKAVKDTHEYGWTTDSIGWRYQWDEEFAKKIVLRTHTTSLSARTLAQLRQDIDKGALPAKYFSVGRVFRNEVLDWKHLAEFYQADGIVVGEVNFRHFLGYLKRYFAKLGFEKARFRPAYFPYTEMSTEIEVFHPEHKTWVELGGAGMFRPEVVKPLLGKDIPVLAWGPGFERLIMIQYSLNDIRQLYWNDLKLLREAKLWLR